ncbi:MAG: hypothetical protein IT196_25395 [Acidimicrobiales bacterium]|nr:hypothetical protein [Acidimicrobiales bacterium]
MSVTPIEHVLVHVTDALATDPRVAELGLAAHLADEDAPPPRTTVVVVEGNVSTPERKANVVTVAAEVLEDAGWHAVVQDRTLLTSPVPPVDGAEDL